MSVLRKIIAFLLSILWVLCTTGLILVSTFLYLLKSPESLKANMRATLLFQPALVSLVNTVVLRSAQEQGVPPQAAVDKPMISALLPPDGFDGVINSAVDNFYTALQIGDIRKGVFLIDKQPFFAHWQSAAGQIAVADLLTTLPICPEPTNSLPINTRATSPQTIFSCVPSEIDTNEIAAQIQQTIEPPRERFLRVPFGALAYFSRSNWLYEWGTLFAILHYFLYGVIGYGRVGLSALVYYC